MKLLYLTSKEYPSTTADHLFIRHMARAFAKLLRGDFSLLIAGSVPEELRYAGAVSVPAPRRFKSVFYFFWIPYFAASRGYTSPEAVFFANDPNLLALLIFWRRLLGFRYRVISEWHMLFNNWRDGFVARGSDGLVTTTAHLKNLIVRRFIIPAERIEVAYGGIDIAEATEENKLASALRESLKAPPGAYLVGYVGFYRTIGMEKGIATMIKALAQIPDASVYMVFVGGRGNEIEEYEKLAAECGVSERCTFVSMVPEAEVYAHERLMDALVIPYPDKPHFRDYGFPMKAYEYMAAGKPIIYSNLPIIDEMLGDCATPFSPDDPKDLAVKILEVKNDPAQAKRMADIAYVKALGYTWDERAKRIIAFVKGI